MFGRTDAVVSAESLVAYALANNPEIQAARYHARQLGARVPQVASLPDPKLLSVAFLESIQTAAGPQEVMLSLSQQFPFFGKRALRSRVAYYEAMAAYARLASVELQVIEKVKRTYYDVYFLQRAVDVTGALIPELDDVVDLAGDKSRLNLAGEETVDQAEIEKLKLETDLIKFQQAEIEAQARLAAILHLPVHTRVAGQTELRDTPVAQEARVLVGLAESYHPELIARSREIRRDQTSTALARRDYWPDATLSLNWYEVGSSGLSPVATGEDSFSLGVGVNLPFYRKRLDAAMREARYRTASTRRQYMATRDQVSAEVRALYAQLERHRRILAKMDEIVRIGERDPTGIADRAYELSKEAYRVNKLDFYQLIDAYRTLLKHRIEYYRHQALGQQVLASLERAVGSAVTAWPVEAADDVEQPAAPLPPPAPEAE